MSAVIIYRVTYEFCAEIPAEMKSLDWDASRFTRFNDGPRICE